MQNLRAALAAPGGHVFAHLPIHRRLERVLDRERAAFDKEHALERRHPDDPPERLDKTGVAFGVNVGVRDLDLRRAQQVGFHLRLIEVRMIETNRVRAEKSVEIDQASIVRGVVEIRTLALFEVDHDAKTVEQNMLGDLIEDAGLGLGFGFLARPGRAAGGSRLGEYGWRTHGLRVSGGRRLVNATNEKRRRPPRSLGKSALVRARLLS